MQSTLVSFQNQLAYSPPISFFFGVGILHGQKFAHGTSYPSFPFAFNYDYDNIY